MQHRPYHTDQRRRYSHGGGQGPIGGEVLPAETVKRRFQQLDSGHIRYVVESLRQTTTKINNIRAYLLTALYNAPVTIGPYYSAAVRHDFG